MLSSFENDQTEIEWSHDKSAVWGILLKKVTNFKIPVNDNPKSPDFF